MKLTVIFETWHIPDGNYDPFYLGMRVKLAFQLEPIHVEIVNKERPESFRNAEDALYTFCGTILKLYEEDETIAVVQFNNFKAYVESSPKGIPKFTEGDRIEGEAELLLDYYIWTESFSSREGVPNLYYDFTVKRIRAVRIPETFITSHEKGMSHPCSLRPGQYGQSDLTDVENMEETGVKFYLVDLDDEFTQATKIEHVVDEHS